MRFFLIILFSIVFGELITSSFEPAIKMIFQIPDSACYFSFWGDSYWTRIIASLLGTLFGGFIIGSHLKEGLLQEVAIIIYSLPIVLFWAFNLLVYYTQSPINLFLSSYIAGSFFESFPPYTFFVPEFSFFSFWHIVPLSLTILSIPVAYLGAYVGMESKLDFSRPGSVLNIAWYHWLWIYLFCIMQIIATFIIFVVSINISNNGFNFFSNLFAYYTTLFISSFGALFILYLSFKLFYFLSDSSNNQVEKTRYKWLKIISIVVSFNLLYNFIFVISR